MFYRYTIKNKMSQQFSYFAEISNLAAVLVFYTYKTF